jgi:hypothetical protein
MGCPHNLMIALLGRDAGKVMRLIGWDSHTGDENEPENGNWIMALNEEAKLIGGTGTLALFEMFQRIRDLDGFVLSVASVFDFVSQQFPRQIGVGFFWQHIGIRDGLIDGNISVHDLALVETGIDSAIDGAGNLLLKNTPQSVATTYSASPASWTLVGPEAHVDFTTWGNKVLVLVSAAFLVSVAGTTGEIAIFRDGLQVSSTRTFETLVWTPGTVVYIDAPPAGSHIYAAYWYRFQGTGTLSAGFIQLQAVELG